MEMFIWIPAFLIVGFIWGRVTAKKGRPMKEGDLEPGENFGILSRDLSRQRLIVQKDGDSKPLFLYLSSPIPADTVRICVTDDYKIVSVTKT